MKVQVDFSQIKRNVKPMHSVNNGPIGEPGGATGNFDAYKAAKIPFARNHDAGHYAYYGGEHVVDVHAIFPNFDADVDDENAYDFTLTDLLIQRTMAAGTQIFYRLGSKIEHSPKKYGTVKPKDFTKWAKIAEHIIRHYNEGWANGFEYNILYWEIWNEPDLHPDDTPLEKKSTWSGTKAEYFEFYHIAATHLKECFPHLKIGGPALAFNGDWAKEFVEQLKAPIDFFSWHMYTCDLSVMRWKAEYLRKLLDDNGFEKTESILNEWNYLKGWSGEKYIHSMQSIKGIKGAAYVAAAMLDCQKGCVDNLMYYDARPTAWNGMFNTDLTHIKLKGYYPFLMFSSLYELKQEVQSTSDNEDLYVCGATDGTDVAVMLSHYVDEKKGKDNKVEISLDNLPSDKKSISVYILDEKRDMQKVKTLSLKGTKAKIKMKLPLYSVCLLKSE